MAVHIWETSYPPGVSWGEPLPEPVALDSLIETAAMRWPERVAIDFYDHRLTFGEIRTLAARAAGGFQALGVGPGVHVGLHLPNTPHYVICFFGVLMAGGRVVNLNPLTATDELNAQIADSEARLIVTLDSGTLTPETLKGSRCRQIIVCSLEDFLPPGEARGLAMARHETGSAGPAMSFAALVDRDGAYTRHPCGSLDDEIAVLQYTGGTSGPPKGVMLTHANFSAAIHVRQRWLGRTVDESHDRTIAILPFSHIFGLCFIMLLSCATGAEIVPHLRFEAERVIADIARKRITVLAGISTMYAAIVNHPMSAEADLSSLRRCSSGGSALPTEVLRRFKALTGLTPQEGYGLTETTGYGTMQLVHAEPRAGTVGLPTPQTIVEIVDVETGSTVLPDGMRGEVCIRGPQLMKGYWKNPGATGEALRGGRYHTGDIGVLDADGYLTLLGRKEDVIVSGGTLVFPRAVEEAIWRHPSVAEAAVIGIPDAEPGQKIKAFIVMKPGTCAITLNELETFLADAGEAEAMPDEIEIRASLPKTAVGKTAKKELLAEHLAGRSGSTRSASGSS
jgi:long-chain acyl-CoA synthetase